MKDSARILHQILFMCALHVTVIASYDLYTSKEKFFKLESGLVIYMGWHKTKADKIRIGFTHNRVKHTTHILIPSPSKSTTQALYCCRYWLSGFYFPLSNRSSIYNHAERVVSFVL